MPSPPSTMRRDILSAYAAAGARIGSWAIVSALVYRNMGPGAFAMFAFVRATLTLLNYASLGLAPAMIHHLAKIANAPPKAVIPAELPDDAILSYETPGKPEVSQSPLQGLYVNGLCVAILLALFASVVVIVLSGEMIHWFNNSTGLHDEIGATVLAIGFGMLLRIVSDPSGAVLQSSGRIATDNVLLIVAEITWVLLAWQGITTRNEDLPKVANAFAYSSALLLALRFIAAERVAPLLLRPIRSSAATMRSLISFGLLVTFAQVADYLYAPMDFILINRLLGAIKLAVYAPAVQIDGAMLVLVAGIASVLLPKSAIAHASGDVMTLRRYYVRGTLATFALLTVAAVAIWVASSRIFMLWLHDPMTATQAILPLVLTSTVVGGSAQVGRSILLGMGKVKPFTISVLIAGLTNVILSIAFVKIFDLGLRGIIYGTIVAVVGRCALWMPWYVIRTLREGKPEPEDAIEELPAAPPV